MTHDEVQELLGAFALDATSPEERALVEAHLESCPRCRAEAATHQETAALLAAGLGAELPSGLWERIAEATFEARATGTAAPLPPLRPVPPVAARRARTGLLSVATLRRLGAGVAAVAACTVLGLASYLGVQVGELRSQVHTLERRVATASVAEAAASAMAGPHTMVTLAADHGTTAVTVVVTPSGVAYWLPAKLSALPNSRTYQLWGLVDDKPVSLGLIGANPRATTSFRVESGATKLMVTAEPAGGVPLPTTGVLAVGAIPPGAID